MNVSDIMAEAVLSTEKSCTVAHETYFVFCSSVKRSLEKLKREVIRCRERCFMRSIQKNSRLQNTICLYSK